MKPIDPLSDEALESLLRTAVGLQDAPAAWVHAAIGQWPAARPSLLQSALKRVRAVLSADTGLGGPLALGTRSASAATRHLLFSAEGLDIDLRIRADGGAYLLSGQILGPMESGQLELAAEGDAQSAPRRISLDELGEFQLGGVPKGRHLLTLQVGQTLIELPSIEVGAPGP